MPAHVPTIHCGAKVKVVKGRKVPIGFEGEVIWQKIYYYGPDRRVQNLRIGIKSKDGEVKFTDSENVERIW